MTVRKQFLAAGLTALILGACASNPPPVDNGRLGWMVGCWRSLDGANQETWAMPLGGIMFGYAGTMQNGQLTAFEQTRIDMRSQSAVYTASPNGQRAIDFVESRRPTVVPVAAAGEPVTAPQPQVVFENGQHDFPQRITYSRTPEGLAATISLLDGSRASTYAWTPCDAK